MSDSKRKCRISGTGAPRRPGWRCPGFGIAALLLALFILAACGEKKGPEAIADEFVAACKAAAQTRKISDLRRLISADYHDPSGRTGQEVTAIAGGYLLRNQSVYIFTRLRRAVEQDGQIEATVLAALAGRPVTDLSALPSLNADLHWFELVLVQERGDWRLLSASWRPAMVDDFFAD